MFTKKKERKDKSTITNSIIAVKKRKSYIQDKNVNSISDENQQK